MLKSGGPIKKTTRKRTKETWYNKSQPSTRLIQGENLPFSPSHRDSLNNKEPGDSALGAK